MGTTKQEGIYLILLMNKENHDHCMQHKNNCQKAHQAQPFLTVTNHIHVVSPFGAGFFNVPVHKSILTITATCPQPIQGSWKVENRQNIKFYSSSYCEFFWFFLGFFCVCTVSFVLVIYQLLKIFPSFFNTFIHLPSNQSYKLRREILTFDCCHQNLKRNQCSSVQCPDCPRKNVACTAKLQNNKTDGWSAHVCRP